MEKLHLDDALEDAPQTRSLLGVFQKDTQILRRYTDTMQQLCSKILQAERDMCSATQALSAHLKSYGKQNFALEGEDSILNVTLQQFAVHLDELSSLHQVFATQLGDSMMYPLNKFLQADLDEVLTMGEMHQICSNDHEQSLARYMKFPRKKEHDMKSRMEVNEDLYVYRKKFHQTALHLFSSLNSLQYKRKTALLEPLVAYIISQRSFFAMGRETTGKADLEEFTGNISASIQGVQAEMNLETKKSVEQMDKMEKTCAHLYHAEPPAQLPFVPPNLSLGQKAGYLFLRSKIALISTRWERCYFFIQGGNLMCQTKDEVAGSLILDLNEEGTHAEPADYDDRRHCFHVVSPKHKKTVILQAENPRERDEWVATINNVVLEENYARMNQAKMLEQGQMILAQPHHGVQKVRSGSGSQDPAALTDASKLDQTSLSSSSHHGSDKGAPVQQHSTEAHSGSSSLSSSLSTSSSHYPPHPVTPTSLPESGLLSDVPISFDLACQQKPSPQTGAKEGPPKRINPFDEASGNVSSQNVTDNSAFCQTFNVRFLGSMQVPTDRGEQLVHETIRQIMAARAIHDVFKMTESLLMVSSEAMRLLDPATNTIRTDFSLEDISYWAVHKENRRLFGFIARTKASGEGGTASYACHVFECNVAGDEICQAIHQATKIAFQVLMDKKNAEKQKFIEQQILLANIQNLEEMSLEEKNERDHRIGATTETDAGDDPPRDTRDSSVGEVGENTTASGMTLKGGEDDETFTAEGNAEVSSESAKEGREPLLSTDGQYVILDTGDSAGSPAEQSPATSPTTENPESPPVSTDTTQPNEEAADSESEA